MLQFAVTAQRLLSQCPISGYAELFVRLRIESFSRFHSGIIVSVSHGIEYFNNVIRYWDNPESFCKKKKEEPDYEYNFVQVLINNKQYKKEKPTWRFWINKEAKHFTGLYYEFKVFKVYWAYRSLIREELKNNKC